MNGDARARSTPTAAQVRRRRLIALLVLGAFAAASASAGAVVARPAMRRRPRRPTATELTFARAVAAGASPARTDSIECNSPALNGKLPALVYLPPGYPRGGPYRVIYFLHGLPADPDTYLENAFVANELATTSQRAIVVAPQGARADNSDREYLDWSPNENWPRAIWHDLVGCIDGRYRTIADRFGRALVGLSAGGYGAFNIGLRNLQTFAAIESWSGYFEATDPSGDQVLHLGSAAAQSASIVPTGASLARSLRAWPSMLAFYVGQSDSRFLGMNQQYAGSLTQSAIGHVFDVYPGGHDGALWRAQAPHWLTMALGYLRNEPRLLARGNDGGGALTVAARTAATSR